MSILKDKCSHCVVWIQLAYDRDQQWAAQNLHFPISWTAEWLLTFLRKTL